MIYGLGASETASLYVEVGPVTPPIYPYAGWFFIAAGRKNQERLKKWRFSAM
jgi:hypothetical protein